MAIKLNEWNFLHAPALEKKFVTRLLTHDLLVVPNLVLCMQMHAFCRLLLNEYFTLAHTVNIRRSSYVSASH